MTEDASQEGTIAENDLQEHQGTEEERQTSETGGSDRAEQSGQETPARPPMMTPWYSDIDQN